MTRRLGVSSTRNGGTALFAESAKRRIKEAGGDEMKMEYLGIKTYEEGSRGLKPRRTSEV